MVEFYPSISENLLINALNFAAEHVNISATDKQVILHAKKSLLFNEGVPWTKKDAPDSLFDVTMGSFDGAETC